MRLPRRLRDGQAVELVEHLGELRARLVVGLVALTVGFGVAFSFHERLIQALNRPLSSGVRPITLGVTEPFMTSFKVSFFAGLALALPVLLWQAWSFFTPAVAPHARRTVAAFVALATGLLAAGVVFGYFVVLPSAVGFLTSFDSNLYDIQVRAASYYSFVLLVMLSVGIAFELPVFLLALVRLGALSSAKLKRNRRTGYVTMAALAVALPGVDPFTTALIMVPLVVLFEGSIWMSVLVERRTQPSRQPEGSLA